MILTVLTLAHVAISLVAIAAGLVVLAGMLRGSRLDGWTVVFLATTTATSATGFLFPFERFLPSHAFGIASLLVLPVAIYARYARGMAGYWRLGYVVSAMLALYLNVFVLVVQVFLKIPPVRALAPTQSEPPFAAAQLVVFASFVVATVVAAIRFRVAESRLDGLSAQPA